MIRRAFIDLDKTLLPFDTSFPVWKAIIKNRMKPRICGLKYRFGVKSIPKSIMVSCFENKPLDSYNAFFYELADDFSGEIDTAVKDWAENLVEKKSKIHIVTASLLPLAEGISRNLGWGSSVGTEIEVKCGLVRGKLNAPVYKGSQKIEAIKQHLRIPDEEFGYCAAAGDSYSDRHLLEKCALRYFPKQSSQRLIKYFNSE